MAGSRVLALDVGDRYVGMAYSDEACAVAFPDRRLDRTTPDFWRQLSERCQSLDVRKIVLGLPLTLRGKSARQAEQVAKFQEQLAAKISVPITLWDERLSSKEARALLAQMGYSSKSSSKKTDEDSLAAYIILSAYLASSRPAKH